MHERKVITVPSKTETWLGDQRGNTAARPGRLRGSFSSRAAPAAAIEAPSCATRHYPYWRVVGGDLGDGLQMPDAPGHACRESVD